MRAATSCTWTASRKARTCLCARGSGVHVSSSCTHSRTRRRPNACCVGAACSAWTGTRRAAAFRAAGCYPTSWRSSRPTCSMQGSSTPQHAPAASCHHPPSFSSHRAAPRARALSSCSTKIGFRRWDHRPYDGRWRSLTFARCFSMAKSLTCASTCSCSRCRGAWARTCGSRHTCIARDLHASARRITKSRVRRT